MCNIFNIRPAHFSCGGENFCKGGFAPLVSGLWTSKHHKQTQIFLRTLSALAKFDLANRRVRQPVQLYTFNAQLPVFGETLVQPDFVVVNFSDVVMSVFQPPVVMRSLFFLKV